MQSRCRADAEQSKRDIIVIITTLCTRILLWMKIAEGDQGNTYYVLIAAVDSVMHVLYYSTTVSSTYDK